MAILASPFLRFLLDYEKFWRRAVASYHTLFTFEKFAVANVVGWSAFLFVIAPLGFYTGFMEYRPVTKLSLLIPGSIGAFIGPCLGEEVLFRALLLPHPEVDGVLPLPDLLKASVLPLAIYVLHHLVHPGFPGQPRDKLMSVFRDWRFLAEATMFGAVLIADYHITGGSLLGVVVAHWIIVVQWLFLWGGAGRAGGMFLDTSKPAAENGIRKQL